MSNSKRKATGYDKFVNWRLLIIPVVLFFIILALPTPQGMKKVGMQYSVGPKVVTNYISEQLFGAGSAAVEQWQVLTARMMEQNMRMGALSKKRFMSRDQKWVKKYKIPVDSANLVKARDYVEKNISDEVFLNIMKSAYNLRIKNLNYSDLSQNDKKNADGGAWKIKVAIAMVVFVVFCFMTECMPLPGVAFCIGLILVFSGVVTRSQVKPVCIGVMRSGLSWGRLCSQLLSLKREWTSACACSCSKNWLCLMCAGSRLSSSW